jgi:hypothetical protein
VSGNPTTTTSSMFFKDGGSQLYFGGMQIEWISWPDCIANLTFNHGQEHARRYYFGDSIEREFSFALGCGYLY